MKFTHSHILGTSLKLVGVVTCIAVAGCAKPTRINFYNPEPTTYEVQTLGDSYIDYENPNEQYTAYIPDFLNQYVSDYYQQPVVYKDRAVSGAELGYILKNEFYAALDADLQDNNYSIKTLIVNGGANNLREPCAASKTVLDLNGHYDPEAVGNEACEDAEKKLESMLTAFFDRIHSQNHIDKYGYPPTIVWLGRYNMPAAIVHVDVLNRADDFMKDLWSCVVATDYDCASADKAAVVLGFAPLSRFLKSRNGFSTRT